MPDEITLSLEIKNSQPIELTDLTESLAGLAEEYKRRTALAEGVGIAEEVRLFVKEMKTGSIIAYLVTYAPLSLPFVEYTNHIVEFCKFLSTAYGYLTGKNREKPDLEKADYINLSRIIEPIAKDASAQLNIGTLNFNAPVEINLNSLEANAAQNAAKREIELLHEPVTGVKEKVLLYWYQARNDPRSEAGDRAIIESIYRGPIKTVFLNESVKSKMLLAADNPFTHAYVVDVTVETVRGKPALYKILNLHEVIEKPSDET
jgi:hypothetical protein